MKTDNPSVPAWTSNVEILAEEECLPVIGNCQVSSILQTLGNNGNEVGQQNIDLIILPPNDLKLPVENSFGLQNSFIVLNEKSEKKEVTQPLATQKQDDNKKKKDNFEDMLYFVCNLCPFLCTKDVKITEHLENAHKNKNVIKLPQLKCPACANIFYHKLSLRSHLIHDHGVGNSDLSHIIQAVIYYSNKKSEEKKSIEKISSSMEQKNIEQLDMNKQENDGDNLLNTDTNIKDSEDSTQDQGLNVITLSQVNSDQNNSDKNSAIEINSEPIQNMSEIKKYKCVVPACNVKLQEMEKLNYHIKCHIENGFECKDCGEKFLFWKPLSSHLWRLHKIDMDLFSCDKCEYKTYSLAKLNNIHKLIHGDVKSFICNICSKAFKNCKQLRNHKITHKDKTEKMLHVCDVCSKSFSDRRQLKVHMDVVHKKIRQFLCSYCGYKGSSRSSLQMHIRQHTGEKPFSCNSCTYTTSDHNSLRRHNLRHTGQKPYKCSYCSYACIQSSTYKTHLKTKHPGMEKDLMFTCQECQFRSVNKDMYILHMVNVHKMRPYLENPEVH